MGVSALLSSCSPSGAEKPTPPASVAVPEAAVAPISARLLDCTHPFSATTSAGEVARSASAALRQTAGELPEASLYPDSPDQVSLRWWDEGRTALESVSVTQPNGAWQTSQGLRVGSSLQEVETANGQPFRINGFGWEYGGYLIAGPKDRLGGMEGGCVIQIRMGKPGAKTATGPGEQGRFLNSDDPEVRNYAPVITEITLSWPLPEGVSPAAQKPED